MIREPSGIRAAFWAYDRLWGMLAPLMRLHPRLAEGFRERIGASMPQPASLWIQAASVGEAYLARELMKRLDPGPGPGPLRVLLTANTRQGLEIHRGTRCLTSAVSNHRVRIGYFPFDRPAVMRRIVARIRPKVTVFLETEIWPGLLRELRRSGSRTMVVNGRMSSRGFRRYRLWPALWRHVAPDEVMAVSEADADRFRQLFPGADIGVMSNIKFDRLDTPAPDAAVRERPPVFSPPDAPFVILGSVRRQEEDAVAAVIGRILSGPHRPVIGLFPRHLHRVGPWRARLNRMGVPWVLRSDTGRHAPETTSGGTVVLWDVIGELSAAYGYAHTAFVGGSLAPLGGQNFIEAIRSGVIPVIGPSWEDFRWVGEEIFERGLARIAADWRAAADLLVRDLDEPPCRSRVLEAAEDYFSSRKGGAEAACRRIAAGLNA
ncbi:3-deoxy-D-manno-octulosonic acid transferase [Desulfococcus multivorans]|uniref:3-deoxy-D-manno-octulosonic acid transferase n=1 Tax=Desulfococcus multivorans DSM 2059 TaxID=1121405 RepID=S7UMY9_DESML|nr:glycosyltransferase N-terminal domain-containing protein [Desulfococcus multivorans]AOY58679.1 WaaA1: predicted 3-deoxy-D-manno-octulosonic-acid transferase [Desulfococcus multivorans]AQV00967.1 hypothetical protein B2D07_09455 [Desulfococcus multivorans]EPR35334.1 Three-deoxy-D-manno-octulosonic-acid transferase domain-containing protein [Desulfococcus multivorans DSM 2059]SJZ46143.1 3-deoxy-D-manno-octulosonic-acid transferase [Desulfococcus multivorans DSM 2059]